MAAVRSTNIVEGKDNIPLIDGSKNSTNSQKNAQGRGKTVC